LPKAQLFVQQKPTLLSVKLSIQPLKTLVFNGLQLNWSWRSLAPVAKNFFPDSALIKPISPLKHQIFHVEFEHERHLDLSAIRCSHKRNNTLAPLANHAKSAPTSCQADLVHGFGV